MAHLVRFFKNLYHFCVASVAVVYYGYPAKSLQVIGVTGTDGKTTTSTMIYHLLKSNGYKVALISTVAAYIGNQHLDTGFHVTSPSPGKLQRLIKRIKDQGYTHVVLETTSHGLDQHRLLGTHIQTAVITNITREHLDYHRTYERYLAAKAKIFYSASTAIINADDDSFPQLLSYVPPDTKLITYSSSIHLPHSGFDQETHQKLVTIIKTHIPEAYNQANAMAAITAALVHKLPFIKIEKALATFPGVPGRMQQIPNRHGINAIVDFAHTPNALEKALVAARKITPGKLIVVFGAAGARDPFKRPLMGDIASQLADEIILTAEDSRHEDVRLIITQIKDGATQNHGHIHAQADRRLAIRQALRLAQKGDTVIVCGKGHEQSMNLDGKREIPWSDAKVVKEEIAHRFTTK
jgi:UDP-N-acetylmuramoyl-L-alanyl-D-glutamate--2,6-diaminopimelate ligase